jgi:hypothetical protein
MSEPALAGQVPESQHQARLAQRKSAAFTRRRSGGRHVDRAPWWLNRVARSPVVSRVAEGAEPSSHPMPGYSSGQRERPVKPPAQPSQVRILDPAHMSLVVDLLLGLRSLAAQFDSGQGHSWRWSRWSGGRLQSGRAGVRFPPAPRRARSSGDENTRLLSAQRQFESGRARRCFPLWSADCLCEHLRHRRGPCRA